jgi:hypothetical protein
MEQRRHNARESGASDTKKCARPLDIPLQTTMLLTIIVLAS